MKKIEFPFPLNRTHAGIAMGNGSMGALIWGVNGINITLNRSDFWDHRGAYRPTAGVTTYAHMRRAYHPSDPAWLSEVFPQAERPESVGCPSRLPFGRFELDLAAGVVPVSGELEWATGQVTLRLAVHGKRPMRSVRFDLDVRRDVLWIDDPGRMVRDVRVRTAWEWVGDMLESLAFPAPVPVSRPGVWGWAQGCPADPALAAVCRRTASGYVIVLERGADERQALEAAGRGARRAAGRGPVPVRKANKAWWQAYWKRAPTVTLPDDFFNAFHRYALYKFAAATNPLCRWPAGLQGPWVEEYQRVPWGGDYHFNVNIQQIYTLAFSANQLEHLMPLFDRLESWRPVLKRNAKVVCGIDDGLILGMCVDDRGEMLYPAPGVVIDHACSGWVAQLFWHYYLYTGDVAFLRERAFPFMLGVMRVYEEMLEARDGRLSLPLCISPEFGNDIAPRWMGRDPSVQLACIHMLTDALLEAVRLLDLEPRPAWHAIKEKLPPYTLIGKPGEERIAIWEGQDLDFCHRHHSHLACIYPFGTLANPTPGQQVVLDNSIDHWISRGMGKWSEWCMPWAAIIQARMGFKEGPWAILQLWRKLFINEGLATVYLPRFRGITSHQNALQRKPLETHEIMQLDGTMAGATALHEMLVHVRGGVTHLFPGVPDDLADVAFSNIRLPGGFLIAASRKRGSLRYILVTSLRGGRMTLQVDGCGALGQVRRGKRMAGCTLPLQLELGPGETVRLEPVVTASQPEPGTRQAAVR